MDDRRLLYKYKGDSCGYCGSSVEEKLKAFHSYAGFNFHHIDPGKKARDYDNLIRRKLTSEQFDEVDKCVLLCCNCHATLHGQNVTVPVDVTLSAEGIAPIKHTLQCQIIENHQTQECTLFSDEFRFLRLYKVQTGDSQAIVMSGIQLKPVLAELIERTQTEGRLVIKNFVDDFVEFEAWQENATDVRVKYNLDFPLGVSSKLTFGTKDKKDHTSFYLRGGAFIADINGMRLIDTTRRRMTLDGTIDYSHFRKSP